MKFRLLLLSVLLVSSFNLAQDYFPLEVGNEWYYEEEINGSGWHFTISNTLSVIEMKVMPNGKEYFQLIDKNLYYKFIWKYVRVDSNKLLEYDEENISEHVVFDFNKGKSYTIKLFDSNDVALAYGDMYYYHRFSKKFGMIEYGAPGSITNDQFRITGCHISGITYGKKIDYSGYLPLSIGNRWFYETKYMPTENKEIIDTVELKVISKKIMPNNMEYYEFSQNFPYANYKFARMDSCKFFFYDEQQNQEILYMDFSERYFPVFLEMVGKTYSAYGFIFMRENPARYFVKNIGLGIIGNFIYQNYKLIGFELADSTYGYTDVADDYENPVIADYELEQNYPNPFNPETNISVALPKGGYVKLTVYDLTGREISKLYQGELALGRHNFKFNGSALSSGIYFYRLESSGLTQTKKMLLLK